MDRRATFDIQVGRVPPTFGAFARRTYASDNPLIGYPLAYQYLTSMRADALPANADELLRMRGRGWLCATRSAKPDAATAACRWSAPFAGTPACRCTRRRRSLERHGVGDRRHAVEPAASRDDNSGRQVAGRVALRRSPG